MMINGRNRYGGDREPPLPDSSTVCPFGKHRGDPVEVLLNDTKYLGWVCKQEGMIEDVARKYPLFGQVLIHAVGSGAPALTPEEKAEEREKLKRQAEEKRLEREAKLALLTPRERFIREMGASRRKFKELYKTAKKVTAARLAAATPGERFFHELVIDVLEQSLVVLDTVPKEADQDALNEAIRTLNGMWKDLPPYWEWWFNQKPVELPPPVINSPVRHLSELNGLHKLIVSKRTPWPFQLIRSGW